MWAHFTNAFFYLPLLRTDLHGKMPGLTPRVGIFSQREDWFDPFLCLFIPLHLCLPHMTAVKMKKTLVPCVEQMFMNRVNCDGYKTSTWTSLWCKPSPVRLGTTSPHTELTAQPARAWGWKAHALGLRAPSHPPVNPGPAEALPSSVLPPPSSPCEHHDMFISRGT